MSPERFSQAVASALSAGMPGVPSGFVPCPWQVLASQSPIWWWQQQLLYALALERARAVTQPSLVERALVRSVN